MRRKATGYIPVAPWIPFSARAALEPRLTPDFFVWEIGSGYSTIWLSQRVRKLVSLEASEPWYQRIREELTARSLSNVDLRHEWRAERMADFSELADGALDLLFIDGGPRSDCLKKGFQKVRGGGWVYLDNWDTQEFWPGCHEFLERHADEVSVVSSYVDYVPAQFGVYEGLLIQKR